MRPFLASHEPSVQFGAVVAGGAGREVVLGDALPRGDLLKRLDRLVPKVPSRSTFTLQTGHF